MKVLAAVAVMAALFALNVLGADIQKRSLNLSDLYVFKESAEITNGSPEHLVFILNTSPRSLPRQQYEFNTQGRYDIRIDRVGTDKAAIVAGIPDIILRFQFGEPDENHQQPMTFSFISDDGETNFATTTEGELILTTPLAMARTPVVSIVSIEDLPVQIFAGLREDPFFYDLAAWFVFRGTGSGFPAARPQDFNRGFNVNSIAVRVPIALLQKAGETVFDTWATVSVPR